MQYMFDIPDNALEIIFSIATVADNMSCLGPSLMPRLLFNKCENSLVNCLYCFGFMMPCQLDCEFKNAPVRPYQLDFLIHE